MDSERIDLDKLVDFAAWHRQNQPEPAAEINLESVEPEPGLDFEPVASETTPQPSRMQHQLIGALTIAVLAAGVSEATRRNVDSQKLATKSAPVVITATPKQPTAIYPPKPLVHKPQSPNQTSAKTLQTNKSSVEPNPKPGMSNQQSDADTRRVDEFMRVLGGLESHLDPKARNDDTGAHGTYQIMPANWPVWSLETFGEVLPRSAGNQDEVARHKMLQYFDAFGSWKLVAVAWFAGPGAAKDLQAGDKSVWRRSDGNLTVRQYVDRIARGLR